MVGPGVGLIAGAGELPVRLAAHCQAIGRRLFVARLPGLADRRLQAFPGADYGFGAVRARFAAFRSFGVEAVCFAGKVPRPDFSKLSLDRDGWALLPKVVAAAQRGDGALHHVLAQACEAAGFRVIGPEALLDELLAPAGALGRTGPTGEDLADVAAAARAVIAAPDQAGQAAVARDGGVLAVEDEAGTDAMLARIPPASPPRGVLVKRTRPGQELRIDLPTIGPATLEGVARAGLRGVAIEAGGALIVDREAVRAAADALGLFVFGFDPARAS